MGTIKAKAKLLPLDAARYLTDDEAIAEYMTAVLDTEDTELFLLALSDVARAKSRAGEPLQGAGARCEATSRNDT
jgi:DNA-binding phage protein